MPTYDPALRLVLSIHGPTALAARLGIVPGAISQWRRVPPRHALAIEKLTGIPLHVLRPDIYPPERVPALS